LIELRHLRYFLTVAEELHFTRAARRLGIGQPPLSQQIQQMERELGAPLFLRNARGVALTEVGEALLNDARAILAHVQRATDHARRIARGEAGRLRLGMINSAPFHPLVPRVIREFGTRYPEVALSIDESSTPRLARAVRAESLDVAFLRPLIGDDSALTVEALFSEEILVALPLRHALTEFPALRLEQLADVPFVLFPRVVGSGLYEDIVSACAKAGFSPKVTQEASQVTSIVNLVAAGLGVSLVPASMQCMNSEQVTYRRIDGLAPRARMSLTWRREDESPTLRNFIDLAHQLVAQQVEESPSTTLLPGA